MSKIIIFYDEVCGLCDRFIRLSLKLVKSRPLEIRSLQQGLLNQDKQQYGLIDLNSIVVIIDGQSYLRSNAILELYKYTILKYPAIIAQYLIPLTIRDYIYNLVAQNRYQICQRIKKQ
ncbi:hypothetical protein pb186bvf_005561 [Paramecium bursaria]